MKISKFFVSGLCLISLLLGCTALPLTPTVSPVSSPEPSPTQSLPVPTLTATPTSSQGLITLTLWVPDFLNPYDETTGGALLLEQIADFTAHNRDVQVEVLVKQASGTGGLYDLLSTAYFVAPSVLPDLVILGSADLRTAFNDKIIQPLPAADAEASRFFSFADQSTQFDDLSYGVPFLAQMEQTVYTARVSTTKPFSWTGVLSEGYTLLFPAGPADGQADDALLAMYLASNKTIVDEQGSPMLERGALEELYRFFAAMLEFESLDAARVLTLKDADACWEAYRQRQGTLSIVPAETYWTESTRVGLPGWIPTRDGDPISLAETWSFALVTNDLARQEAARELADWLTDAERVAELSRSVRLLPANRDAVALWSLTPEEAEFLAQLMQAADPLVPPAQAQPVKRALQAGLELLLKGGGTTPEQAATHALTVLRK